MRRLLPILAILVALALPPGAQGLSASEREERCQQPAEIERYECERAISEGEGKQHNQEIEERAKLQEQERTRAEEAAAAAAARAEQTREAEAKTRYAAEVAKGGAQELAAGEGVACLKPAEWQLEDAPPKQFITEATEACHRLLNEKIATAWSEPVSLDIAVQTHKGHSTKTPGYTTLGIWASQFAHVRFTLRRHGHRTYDYVANHPGAGEAVEWRAFTVEWSCKSPGGIYRYTVEAWTGKNKEVMHGRFKPVSTEWCRTTAGHELEARERKDREWREAAEREHAEYVRREREAEENCRKLGGTVVTIHGEAGPVRVCRSPEAYVPL